MKVKNTMEEMTRGKPLECIRLHNFHILGQNDVCHDVSKVIHRRPKRDERLLRWPAPRKEHQKNLSRLSFLFRLTQIRPLGKGGCYSPFPIHPGLFDTFYSHDWLDFWQNMHYNPGDDHIFAIFSPCFLHVRVNNKISNVIAKLGIGQSIKKIPCHCFDQRQRRRLVYVSIGNLGSNLEYQSSTRSKKITQNFLYRIT